MAPERPTILQIVPRLDTGGAELSAVEIAAAIVRAGGRALVLAEPGGRLAPRITERGGEVIPFPADAKSPLKLIRNARDIARMIARERVDLVHARSRAPAWSALAAARRAGVPFVTTYHGAYSEKNALKRLYNSVMARGDVVIANSRYTAELIASRYGTEPSRLEVIHRGIDGDVFSPDKVAPGRIAALRESWGVDAGQRVVLQAARLTFWKGQAVLIEAASRLAAKGLLDSVVIVLAGDAQGRDAYAQALRAQVAEAGLEDCVRLVGHVEDIPAACLAAHVTVVASTEPEAFGRTAIEAQAMGAPVIATAIGAPPETVLAEPSAAADAITGWLVPPGDAAALADRLATALALSAERRAALARRARAHVLAQFTVEAMQRRTLAVYDRLLGTVLERRFTESIAGHIPAAALPRQP